MNKFLELKNISKIFETSKKLKVLKNLSYNFNNGKIIKIVVGPTWNRLVFIDIDIEV